jgi:hypothetical protein
VYIISIEGLIVIVGRSGVAFIGFGSRPGEKWEIFSQDE